MKPLNFAGSSLDDLRSSPDEANAKGWTFVNMKKGWKRVFAWEK